MRGWCGPVAADLTPTEDGLAHSIPQTKGLVPSGWYALFLIAGQGMPAGARWVQVA